MLEKALELRSASRFLIDQMIFSKVSFELNRGDALGLFGDEESGCEELLQCIYGAQPLDEGNLSVFQRDGSTQIEKLRKICSLLSIKNYFEEELEVIQGLQFWCSLYGISKEESYRRTLELSRLLDIEIGHGDEYSQFDAFEKSKISVLKCLLVDPQIVLIDRFADQFKPAQTEWWLKVYRTHFYKKKTIICYSENSGLLEKMVDYSAILNRGNWSGIKPLEVWRSEVDSKEIVQIDCSFEEAQYLTNKLRHFKKVFQTELGLRVYLHKEQTVQDIFSVIERPSLRVRKIGLEDIHLHYTGRLIEPRERAA